MRPGSQERDLSLGSPAWIRLAAPIDVIPVISLVENTALFVEAKECNACHRQALDLT
jgi:hypothetical protein